MFGIDLLPFAVATYLFPAQTAIECKAQSKPVINVTAATLDIRYDYSKKKNKLAQREIDTVSPYSHEEEVFVGGLMVGEIQRNVNVSTKWANYESLGQSCYWYGEINVHMEIDPTIYIASEFPRGSCEHSEILRHEQMHIAVDRFIVKKYRKLLEQYLHQVVAQVPVYGPVKSSQTPVVRKEMTDFIGAAIEKVMTAMEQERRQRQQAIDSREEYDRVSNACK